MRRLWGLLLAATVIPSCSSDGAASDSSCDTAPCTEPARTPSSTTLPDGGPATPPPTALTLTLEPNQLVVKPGTSADVTVVVTRPSDLVEPLTVEVAKLPANIDAITAAIPGDRTRASFRLTVGANAQQGTYAADVTVHGSSKTVTTRLPFSVIGAPGALETAFGKGGRATAAVDFAVTNIGVQPDGHVVLAGTAGAAAPHDHVAVRFDALGVADAAFGSMGKAVFDYGGDDYAQDALVQRDGKIVIAGYLYTPETYAMIIGRFNADGTQDPTFGTAGKISLAPTVYNIFYGLHEQPDGKLLAAGIRHTGLDYNCSVTRFSAQGALDPSFGAGGYGTLDMGSQDYCLGVATDSQGRVVVTGERYNGTGYDMVSGRFTAAGVVDTTFGAPNGWVNSVPGAALISFGWTTLVQPDGKMLVAGSGPGPSAAQDFMLYRYNDNGTPDATFGKDGKAAFDVGAWDRIYRIALDSQNRIVFVGPSSNDATARAVVGRVLPNGQIDTTFGQGGRVVLDFTPSGSDSAQGLKILKDDHILVGGTSTEATKITAWVAKLWP